MSNNLLITISLLSILIVAEIVSQNPPSSIRVNTNQVSSPYSRVEIQYPHQHSGSAPQPTFVSPAKVRSVNVPSFAQDINDIRIGKEEKPPQRLPRVISEGEFLSSDRGDARALSNATRKALEYINELNVSAKQENQDGRSNVSFVCSKIFEDGEFYIRSPNYPLNYPPFLSCRYVVRRRSPGMCGVHWTVLKFDLSLEASKLGPDRCSGDVLTIGDQHICGRIGKGAQGFSPFTSSTLVLKFDTGDGFGSSGFLIKGRQIHKCLPVKPFPEAQPSSVPCNSVINDLKFTFASPSFPLNYPANLECHYEVVQANWDVCGLLLTPSSFDVEGGSYCMFDYLEIQGTRLCGRLVPQEPFYYMFGRKSLVVRFRTDENISHKGFMFEGRQILCKDLEYFQPIHSPLASRQSRLNIKTEHDLHNIQDLSHILSLLVNSGVPQNTLTTSRRGKSMITPGVESTSESFKLRDETLTMGSTLISTTVPDIHDIQPSLPTDDLLGVFSRLVPPIAPQYIPLDRKWNQLTDNAGDSCQTNNSSRVFLLRSVAYPNTYPSNRQCTHYIKKWIPEVCQLRLTLEDVDIDSEKESNISSLCSSDFLEIAGYKICGTFANKTINISFPGEMTAIIFHSGSNNISGRGYLIKVEQLNQGCQNNSLLGSDNCDFTISHENFTLFSPGYPHFYPPNLHCTTTVHKSSPNITSLEVKFKKFNVESAANCVKDYLVIGERRFCGHRNGNAYRIPFHGETLGVTFISDEDNSSGGYVAQIRQVPQSDTRERRLRCGAIFYAPSFTIVSPEYPQPHPPNLHCTYTIERNSPYVCQIQIQVILLDIKGGPDCREDYLNLGNVVKICGQNQSNKTHVFHFTNKEFNITFHSNSTREGKGFKLEVSQRSCEIPSEAFRVSQKGVKLEPSPQDTKKCSSPGCNDEENDFRINSKLLQSETPSVEIPENLFHHFDISHIVNIISNSSRVPTYLLDPKSDIPFRNHLLNDYRSLGDGRSTRPHYCNWCPLYSFINYPDSRISSDQPSLVSPDTSRSYSPSSTLLSNKEQSKNTSKSRGSGSTPLYIRKINIRRPAILEYRADERISTRARNLGYNAVRYRPNFLSNQLGRGSSHIANRKRGPIWDIYREHYPLKSRPYVRPPYQTFPQKTLSETSVANEYTVDGSFKKGNTFQSPISGVIQRTKAANTNRKNSAWQLQRKETQAISSSLGLCNLTVSSREFRITSPGYPGPFYAGIKCLYSVRRNDSSRCGLLLESQMMDLPGWPRCTETFLSVAGRHLCGTKANGYKVVIPFSPTTPIRLEFQAGPFHTGAGFILLGRQIGCGSKHDSESPIETLSVPHQAVTKTKGIHSMTRFSPKPVFPRKSNRFPKSDSPIWQPSRFSHRIPVPDDEGVRSNPILTSTPGQAGKLRKAYFAVPWISHEGVRLPPYETGYDLFRRFAG